MAVAGRWRHGSLHVTSLGLALKGEAAKGRRLREQSEARSLQNGGFKMWNAARSRSRGAGGLLQSQMSELQSPPG